jgi:hypothetical protein
LHLSKLHDPRSMILKLFLLIGLVKRSSGRLPYGEFAIEQDYGQDAKDFILAHEGEGGGTHHRRLSESDDLKELQKTWWNWNLCSNAYFSTSVEPMNELVPEDAFFLAGYFSDFVVNETTCKPVLTRTGNITAGNRTVFFPIINYALFDVTDDWLLGREGCAKSPSDADLIRYSYAVDQEARLTNTSVADRLYSTIDGTNLTRVFLYDGNQFFMDECPGFPNRNTSYYGSGMYPDPCDGTDQNIEGLDSYPLLGWWSIDTRVWAVGETHTYEFGAPSDCILAKYVLTAVADDPDEDEECEGLIRCFLRDILCFFFVAKCD